MLSHIEFFITYTVEAIMLFYLGQNIFEPTKSSNWRIGYLAFSHGIMMLICPLHILWVNMGAYFSVSVVYFLFFHEREIWKSFFFGIFTVVTEALAEMFAVGVITIATPDYRIFQPPLEAIHYREIEGALLACVLYAFLCCLIIRIQGKKRIKEENRSFWMLFFASMLVSVVAVEVVISRVLFEEELGRGKLLVFMTVFVILAEVIMVVGLRNAAEKSNVERELLQLSQRESEQAEYYRLLSEQYERRSLLIHDIKNHLIAIRELSQTTGEKEIEKYVNELISDTELTSAASVSDNDFVNALVLRYMNSAKKKGVDMSAEVRTKAFCGISERALVAILGNLLDNALEAATGSENAFIELRASRAEGTDYITIKVLNSCAKPPRKDNAGHFISDKHDDGIHGYGLRSVQRVVDKYDGMMTTEYDVETNIFVVELILLSKEIS